MEDKLKAVSPVRGKVVQEPPPINAADVAAAAIDEAEARQKAQAVAMQATQHANLPQNVLDEMQAGRSALARHAPAQG